MRRAGGWILGATIVAAMAAGAWMAFRPILKRETFTIPVTRGWRDPSSDAMISGMEFALEKAGGKAGGYRLKIQPHTNEAIGIDTPMPRRSYPPLWIDLGESSLAIATVTIENPKTLIMEKHAVLRVLSGPMELGTAAAAWARVKKAGRIAVLHEVDPDDFKAGFKDEFFGAFVSAAGNLPVTIIERSMMMEFYESAEKVILGGKPAPELQDAPIPRALAANPDLVLYTGEKAPYGRAFEFFEALRKAGYRGLLAMTDSDPEVSYLAVPAKVIEGTFLLSTISPPSREFAAVYESSTGRHAGPHAWPGYLLMNAVLDLIDRAETKDEATLCSTLTAHPPAILPCALYQYREGKFVFVQDLK